MSTVELDNKNFEETVNGNDIVVVDFWAPWCGPCKSFAPIYEAVSEEIEGVVFAKVNTEDQQDLSAHFQIRSIPTLMIFKKGNIEATKIGAIPKSQLFSWVEEAL